MRKVYAIGESLIDIIFNEGDVKAARPGGSMLNSAISLGRAGININLLSEFGQDNAGNFIASFLEKNHVNTQHIHRFKDGKSPIALAFLNEKGDASYDFYKLYPKDRLALQIPEFTSEDIFLFGSFFGLDPDIREALSRIILHAKEKGALIVYDPNFRKPHAHQLEQLRPYILENLEWASIVKASNEDMELIFGESTPSKLRKIEALSQKPLIITQGAQGAVLDTPGYNKFFPAQKIEVLSTIGAGDNFNAGLIYGLINQGVNPANLEQLPDSKWDNIIPFAMGFAANVCMSYDNYISYEFAKQLSANGDDL